MRLYNNIWLNPVKLFIIVSFATSCSVQTFDSSTTNTKTNLFKTNEKLENRGKHVTSKGELRALLINVIFQDDTTKESEGWEISKTILPSWSQTLLNNSTELNFPNKNLTQYFYEMSNGYFMLYGDVYPKVVVPKFSQSHYSSIAEVNSEILTELDDEIDFSKYDNWLKDKDGKYVNKSDGKVDMIFILYRNFENRLFFNNGWTGIAHLYLNEDIETDDGVKIAAGRLDHGSGIQSRGGYNGYNYTKYVLAHEFGHFLFGAFHIENVTNLALMTGGPVWNASRGMHSWERNKLGWMKYKDIPLNKDSEIKLDDYITNVEAARIKLSDDEWYVLENHQQLSNNDWAKSKGIYIYHIENANGSYPKITVKCADGNWDFKIDDEDEKLIKTTPNRSGKNELNFGRKVKKKSYAAYQQVYDDNSAWGDEFDSYNLEHNNLISPVSNPPSSNSRNIEFAIDVKKKYGTKYLINIYFDDIYQYTSPAKPQLTAVKYNSKENLQLMWLKNEETDLVGYNFYYSTSLNPIRSFYIPSSICNVELNKYLQTEKTNTIWLTAVDKDNRESVNSDYYILTYNNQKNTWQWIRKEII